MSEEHDRQFIKTFSAVLAGLVAFKIAMIVLALIIHERAFDGEQSAARQAAVEERLRPVADVYAGETGRAAAQEAAQASQSEQDEAAFDGSTDGEMIYSQVCAACHDSGAAGAPTLQADAWGDRLDKGRDELLASAINGLGAMPPRGGRPDLSDEQVAASVDYMLDQLD